MNQKVKRKRSNYIGYYIFRFLIRCVAFTYFGGKVIGKENIPKEGRIILAGNHTDNFDPYLVFSGTNRPVHFIAKKELFSNQITSWFFNVMGLIPVDRKHKNPEARKRTIELLNDNKVVAIFPEGTFRGKENGLLPFKKGAVEFAKETNSLIVPFAITGKYKFRSNPKIIFGNPIDVSNMDVIEGNEYLKETVEELLKK